MNYCGGEGAEVVYALRNDPTLANLVLDNIGDAGQIKRKVYQRRLPENPNKDYYYVIRETTPTEAILVEYGFIDNKRDLAKLQSDLDKYAEGVVKAIATYTNTPYSLPGSTSVGNYYTVKRGDTLWGIAQENNVSVYQLKQLNNLSSNVLSIGQKILLPTTTTSSNSYIVQKGDSLWSIAQKNGVNVNDLIKANNLSNLTIYVGQELTIPSTKSSNEYTVKRGDTLWDISRKYNVSVNDLIQANNLTSTVISPGQILIVQ